MTHRALETVFTFVLLNCIKQGMFRFCPLTLMWPQMPCLRCVLGFQPVKPLLGEVMILSVCIPADSMQYPLWNGSDLACLLFLAHLSQPYLLCLTGRQDAEIFRYETMAAEAGQDITLPCPVESNSSIHIIMIEWSKKRNGKEKLALYSSRFGEKRFSPNVTLTVDSQTMASKLNLHGVTKWDSGIYICSLSTFPLGSIRGETELKVRGKKTKLLQ